MKLGAVIKAGVIMGIICCLHSCIINNPKPEECVVEHHTIIEITEGSSYDIVFRSTNGDRFYINRGLEQGLSLDLLKREVSGKRVKLHLPKLLAGLVTSEHISQLQIDDRILFTEFD